MKVLLTGSEGFLGWHLRARMLALTNHQVVTVDRLAWPRLSQLAKGVDAIIHIAGINRGTSSEVAIGNVNLARTVAAAIRCADQRPVVVFANSIQAGNDTPYGVGKANAASILAAAADDVGSTFVDIKLPNLFGEHGRPDYNSFVASFTRSVIDGDTPSVSDRRLELLHAQSAAQVFLEAVERKESVSFAPGGTPTTVLTVFEKLHYFNGLYANGDIPLLASDLDVDLFNTLRAAMFPSHYPILLDPRSDDRGRLTEVVRSHGGTGQTFVSTSKPGVTRGEHFHLRKIERFVVLAGEALISLRRLFGKDVVTFAVNGQQPAIVDMPTLWVHNIKNTGSSELTTLFWTQTLFDPAAADTFAEPVGPVVSEPPAKREPSMYPSPYVGKANLANDAKC